MKKLIITFVAFFAITSGFAQVSSGSSSGGSSEAALSTQAIQFNEYDSAKKRAWAEAVKAYVKVVSVGMEDIYDEDVEFEKSFPVNSLKEIIIGTNPGYKEFWLNYNTEAGDTLFYADQAMEVKVGTNEVPLVIRLNERYKVRFKFPNSESGSDTKYHMNGEELRYDDDTGEYYGWLWNPWDWENLSVTRGGHGTEIVPFNPFDDFGGIITVSGSFDSGQTHVSMVNFKPITAYQVHGLIEITGDLTQKYEDGNWFYYIEYDSYVFEGLDVTANIYYDKRTKTYYDEEDDEEWYRIHQMFGESVEFTSESSGSFKIKKDYYSWRNYDDENSRETYWVQFIITDESGNKFECWDHVYR